MAEQNREIKKPWAVYRYLRPSGIGKIMSEHKFSLNLLYSEGQYFPTPLWNPDYVKRFETSLEAIEYFLPYSECENNKEKLVEIFLFKFPSERTNLEKLLTQTSPKCTEQKDGGPLGINQFKKDNGFVHPHKKY
jgi:hypothetical protein